MELKCMLMRNSLLNGKGREKIFPKVTNYEQMSAERFIEKVASSSRLTRGEIKSVLAAVTDELVTWVGNGHAVTIEDLGTFSVSMKGDAIPDDKGVLQLRNAHVSGVNFIPSKWLKSKLHDVKFTLVNHNVKEGAQLSDEELMEAAGRAANSEGYITRQAFVRAAKVSYSYAGKVLKRLAEEGKLERDEIDRFRIK